MTSLRTLAIAALLMLAVACGGGDDSPSEANPGGPISTAELAPGEPSPTHRPEVTATPLPTVSLQPSPTPAAPPAFVPNPDLMPLGVPLGELSAQQFEILGYEVADFPLAMEPGEPFVGNEQVVELWTEFLSGTRFVTNLQSTEVLLCANGLGLIVREEDQPSGRVFEWDITHSPASRSNDILIMNSFLDGEPHPRFENGPQLVHRQEDSNVSFGGGGAVSEPGFESIVVKDPDCESYLP